MSGGDFHVWQLAVGRGDNVDHRLNLYASPEAAKRGAQAKVDEWLGDWEPEWTGDTEEVLTDELVWEDVQQYSNGPENMPGRREDKYPIKFGDGPVPTAYYSEQGYFTIIRKRVFR